MKFRLFKALARGRQLGEELDMYAKHILARTRGVEPGNPDKTNLEKYFIEAKTLFRSMSDTGFDPNKPVPVDQWGRLRDGAHRVACAAVLGYEVEVSYRTVQYPIRQWGIDWFLANGFSRTYVNGLLDHLNIIIGYSNAAAPPTKPGLS